MSRVSNALLAAAVAWALAVIPAAAQSRGERHLRSSPAIGWGPSSQFSYYVGRYSTGLSDLNLKYRPAASGGVLGSTIYRTQSRTIRRPGSSAASPFAAQPAGAPRGDRSRQVYSPTVPTHRAPARRGGMGIGGYVPVATASAADGYIAATGSTPTQLPTEVLQQVITSLVPRQPAPHTEAMRKGEEVFRDGDYAASVGYFESARVVSGNSPESLLSLARASFATASYAKAAGYLAEALEIVPELPMVHVFPRSFYGNQDDYRRHAAALIEHVEAHGDDAGARIVLGYLRWRQGKADEARAALAAAPAHTDNTRLRGAVRILLAGIDAAEKVVWAEPPKMAQPVDYRCAGIRIALPAGFTDRPLNRMHQVLHAGGPDDDTPVVVAMAALPVGADVTGADVVEHVMGQWRSDPAVTDLSIVEQREVSMAELPGVGVLFTYVTRGQEAAALGIVVVRKGIPTESDGEPVRLGYGLLVRTTRENMTAMIGIVNGMAASAELTGLHRPIDMPVEPGDDVIRDLQGRYTLRLPRGWAFQHDETGIVAGQLDYLLGGVSSPSVRIITLDVPESMTAQATGESAIQFVTTQRGHKITIMDQGPATVAGSEAYQFVLRKRVPVATGEQVALSEPFIQVSRLVGVAAGQQQRRYYVLILTGYDCDATPAVAAMDTIAAGFKLLETDAGAATSP